MLSLAIDIGSQPHYALFVIPSLGHQHELVLAVRRGRYVGLPIAKIEPGKRLAQILREAVSSIAVMSTVDPALSVEPINAFEDKWDNQSVRFSVFAPPNVLAIHRLNSGLLVPRYTGAWDRIGTPDFSMQHVPGPGRAVAATAAVVAAA